MSEGRFCRTTRCPPPPSPARRAGIRGVPTDAAKPDRAAQMPRGAARIGESAAPPVDHSDWYSVPLDYSSHNRDDSNADYQQQQARANGPKYPVLAAEVSTRRWPLTETRNEAYEEPDTD